MSRHPLPLQSAPATLPLKVYACSNGWAWRTSIQLCGSVPFSKLLDAVRALITDSSVNVLEWIDEDGDFIRLCNDDNVAEAIQCRADGKPLKLRASSEPRMHMADGNRRETALHRKMMAEIKEAKKLKQSVPRAKIAAKPADRGLIRYEQRRAEARDTRARVNALRAADTAGTKPGFADCDVYTRMLKVGVPALAVANKMRADIIRRPAPAAQSPAQTAVQATSRPALLADIRKGKPLQNVSMHVAPPLAGQCRHAILVKINKAIKARVPEAPSTAPAGYSARRGVRRTAGTGWTVA